MVSYRESAAEWRGPLPTPQNVDGQRREAATPEEKADPNAANTGAPYDLTRGSAYIVLHHMDGTWQGADTRFKDPGSQVSAHYGLRQDGTLIQWVDEADASYGAGVFEVNRRAINIELEDLGQDAYTTPQLQTLVKLLAGIAKRYELPLVRGNVTAGASGVIGHSEIPYPTQCPGRLLDLVPDLLNEAQTIINAPGPVPPPRPNPLPTPTPAPPDWVPPKGFLQLLLDALLRLFHAR
jgi:N-acetylmuramoyl-L-alanine amidase